MNLLAPLRSPSISTLGPGPDPASSPAVARAIAFRTRGHRHGPITRFVSPSDVGERIKPFVFLDGIDIGGGNAPDFGFHPHSGIATLTLLLEGGFSYEDSTGAVGTLGRGAVEWMRAGGGVWHKGGGIGDRIKGYQLWVALPPGLENGPPMSQYLSPERFGSRGPARVILGELGGVRSPIESPSPMNVLDVRLAAGEVWRYDPPAGHDVAWIAVHEGQVSTPQPVPTGELAVFEESAAGITFSAEVPTAFVLGSARKHPHELALGNYSVHTNRSALEQGESGIRRVAQELRRAGRL